MSISKIKYSCPLIDKIIKIVNECLKQSDTKFIDYTEETIHFIDKLNDINYSLYGLDDDLEEVRSINNELRNMGNHYESIIEKLEQQIYQLEQQNNDLQDEIIELKQQLCTLEIHK